MTEGYSGLTRSAAAIDLSPRTRIRATGEDRARLLHALTTNDVRQLLPGHGCYAFFLNANGRVLADANLLAFADHILIDAEPEARERLWAHIDHYIIADDVNLHDDGEVTFCVGVEGPHALERMCQAGGPAPSNAWAHEEWRDYTVARVSFTGAPGVRVFGPAARKDALLELLYLPKATAEDAEMVRVEHGRPRYGVDITEANLAAETGLTEALHFQKGCYLGQEIVERVRSRGHVNKRLVRLEIGGDTAPAAGSKLVVEGKEAGEVTSAAWSPGRGRVMGLGYARVGHERVGSLLEVAGERAEVVG